MVAQNESHLEGYPLTLSFRLKRITSFATKKLNDVQKSYDIGQYLHTINIWGETYIIATLQIT